MKKYWLGIHGKDDLLRKEKEDRSRCKEERRSETPEPGSFGREEEGGNGKDVVCSQDSSADRVNLELHHKQACKRGTVNDGFANDQNRKV